MLQSSKFNFSEGGMFFAVVLSVLICQSVLAASMSGQQSADNNTTTATPLILSGKSAHGTHSSGVDEILRMLDAQLDSQVILAYIQKSAIAYNPDATDLIALKDHGASTEMMVTLMHRGQELSARIAQVQQAASRPVAPVPVNTGVPAAAPEYAPQYAPVQPVPAYSDSYPVYTYGYPVGYNTLSYWWWPGYYGCFYNGCWHYYHGGGHFGFGHGAGFHSFGQASHFHSAFGHPVSFSGVGHVHGSFAHSGGGHMAMAMHSGGRGRGR